MPAVARVAGDALLEYQVCWIGPETPPHLRRVASAIALVECRETGWACCFDGGDGQEDSRLVLVFDNDRAVAMVMLVRAEAWFRMRWEGERVLVDEPREVQREPQLGIGRVWVAADYRRRNLASKLVRYVTARSSSTPCDAVWMLPLSRGGRRLVKALCPQTWRGHGNWMDLEDTVHATED